MLLGEEELERMQRRFPYPRFSRAEYERRYANIRAMMRALNLDCLLIVGGSAAYGRLWFNFRYVTNMMGKAEMANYCLFPSEGEPAVVDHLEDRHRREELRDRGRVEAGGERVRDLPGPARVSEGAGEELVIAFRDAHDAGERLRALERLEVALQFRPLGHRFP